MYKNASIWNDEELYRSIRQDSDEYIYENGKLRIRSNAFRDRSKRVSVDRAKLRNFNLFCSKLNETDAIISLIAGDLRQKIKYLDVQYKPKSNNYAHAEIVIKPEYLPMSDNRFYKIRKALAKLATQRGWTITPH